MTTRSEFRSLRNHPVEFIIRLGAPLLWSGIILWLSLTSSPPQVPGVLGWDKLLHAGAYGLLTVLVAQFLQNQPFLPKRPWLCSVVVAVGYGGLLEVLQLLSHTGRTAEWWDLGADAVGACLAWALFHKVFDSDNKKGRLLED